VTFSGGFPTGVQNNGLILTYIPNKIYSATLTHTQNQAGTIDTYVFTFKITNDIPRNGYIRLRFPSPWTSAPQNIQSLTKSIKIYGTEKTGYMVQTPITSEVVYSGLFDMVGLTADASKTI
jgi:hypothetical protein